MNIFLIGYRCTGKTTIGTILADLFEYAFWDTDQVVQEQAGMSIEAMVKKNGWPCFRHKEAHALEALANQATGHAGQVISTGGGIVLDPENRKLIREKGTAVWLKAEPAVIIERLGQDTRGQSSRPALTRSPIYQETVALLAERSPLYQETARFSIDTKALSPDQAARQIQQHMENFKNLTANG